ncbi:MAG: hypothetical protein HY000_31520, partial [Planctomycetes bacterium]|nr:hypothetical protein [Planctomycetota bacterium]
MTVNETDSQTRFSSPLMTLDAEHYPKIAQLKDVAAFRARLAELGLELPLDDRILTAAEGSLLAEPMDVAGFRIGNRWCIH